MKTKLFLLLAMFAGFAARSQKLPSWKITDVVKYYSGQKDSVYVVSFWATYCKPCIAEIPFMQEITKKYAGNKVKLLLVSLDLKSSYPSKIRSFIKNNAITADVVWLNETDADYFCNQVDKKWSGSIPATLIVNDATGYRHFYEQEFKKEEFERELLRAMTSER